MIKSFLNRIEFDPEESLTSYLYRLAIANYHDSPKQIGDSLGTMWWEFELNTFDETACDKLSTLSGIDKKNLYTKSYHSTLKYLEENQYKMWFVRSKAKYCPKCLDEKKIHKYLWGLRPVNICTKHSVVLVNQCENCKHKINIKSLINRKCSHCKFNLEFAKAVPLDKDDYLYVCNANIQHLLNNDSNDDLWGLNKFQVMNLFDSFLRLFDGFETFIEWKGNNCDKKICLNASNEMDYVISFANVYWMLFENFPQNFFHALDVFQNSNSPRKKYRRRQLLNLLTNHEEFDFVMAALESFKENQIKNGLVPRNIETFDKSSASKLKKMYYTKKELFRRFDISKGEIDKLCDIKVLKPMKVTIENHTNYYFEKCETEKIIKTYLNEKKDLITKKEAANILGIGVGAMIHLIENGIIVQKNALIEKQHSFIYKKSVNELLKKLSDKVIIISRKDTRKYISLVKSLQKYVTSGLQIGKILQWSISNEIVCYSSAAKINIKDLYFDDTNLKNQLHKEYIEINGYSLGDVSKILGFTERTLHKMIKANIITPERTIVSKQGIRVYFFEKSKIEHFRENYITAVNASTKYKVNYSTLNNFSHKKILRNYLDGVCKKTLFNKEELERELIKRGFIEV